VFHLPLFLFREEKKAAQKEKLRKSNGIDFLSFLFG
jgi:hypothetical protein